MFPFEGWGTALVSTMKRRSKDTPLILYPLYGRTERGHGWMFCVLQARQFVWVTFSRVNSSVSRVGLSHVKRVPRCLSATLRNAEKVMPFSPASIVYCPHNKWKYILDQKKQLQNCLLENTTLHNTEEHARNHECCVLAKVWHCLNSIIVSYFCQHNQWSPGPNMYLEGWRILVFGSK